MSEWVNGWGDCNILYAKKMKLLYYLLIILTYLLSSCSQKVSLPLREIDRTITYPNNYYGINLGAGPVFNLDNNQNTLYEYNSIYPAFNFSIPYINLNKKTELHFLLPGINYYLKRNDTVINNIYKNTGKNWIIGTRMMNIGYGAGVIFSDIGIYTYYRNIINKNTWFEFTPMFTYNLNNSNIKKVQLNASPRIAYQVSKRFYISASSGIIFYYYKNGYILNKSIAVYPRKTYKYYTLSAPIVGKIGCNINPHIKAYIDILHSLNFSLYTNAPFQPINRFTAIYFFGLNFCW